MGGSGREDLKNSLPIPLLSRESWIVNVCESKPRYQKKKKKKEKGLTIDNLKLATLNKFKKCLKIASCNILSE